LLHFVNIGPNILHDRNAVNGLLKQYAVDRGRNAWTALAGYEPVDVQILARFIIKQLFAEIKGYVESLIWRSMLNAR
jgi:hypothetical protein